MMHAAMALIGVLAAGNGPARSVLQLSQARRAVSAAATASGTVIFAGGCLSGRELTCNPPAVSDVVDVIPAVGPAPAPLKLSTARGWTTACALGESIALLGGGQASSRAHSRALDIVDMVSKTVTSNATALDRGRWGTACITTADAIYFAGGKEISAFGKPGMTDEVLVLPGPTLSAGNLAAAPWKLGRARESVGAMPVFGGAGIVWAGGWDSLAHPAGAVAMVDAFQLDPPPGGPGRFQWNLGPQPDDSFWVGAAPWNDTLAFLADATLLYTITPAVFQGIAPPVTSPLPRAIAATHGITTARMGGNGVRVAGVGVCFYATAPSALVCYSPATEEWTTTPCSTGHVAGAMVAANRTVYVGGGLGTPDTVTKVIDVFKF